MLDATSSSEVVTPVLNKHQVEERRRMLEWFDEQIRTARKKRFSTEITLTPVLAQILLDRNNANRAISRTNAHNLASDIANGRWLFNGSPIVVTMNGRLGDGQHRCDAVIKTGISIPVVIQFGVPEDAITTIDIGRPKSAGDFLTMAGHKYTNHMAATARLVLLYRKNGSLIDAGARGDRQCYVPTKTETVDAVDHLPGLAASVEFCANSPSVLGGKSVLMFAHYMISKRAGRDSASEFMGKVLSGENMSADHPIMRLRSKLMNGRGSSSTERNLRGEAIFRAWNLLQAGVRSAGPIRLNGRMPKLEG